MSRKTNFLSLWTTLGTLSGAILGIWVGWKFGESALLFRWMGDLFLNALKFVVVPLILSAMIVGISSLGDVRRLGRFGGWTVGYFIATSAVAALIGISLVLFFQPGNGFVSGVTDVPKRIFAKADYGLRDFVLSFLGGGEEHRANIFYSLANMEMLPVVVFSVSFGVVLTLLGETGQPVIAFFRGFYEAIMKIVQGIIFFTPLGVFGLVATKVGMTGGGEVLMSEIGKLGAYCGTVLTGLFLHGFVILPLFLFFLARRNPVHYAKGMTEALLTAFSTASSAATLPVTTKNVTVNNRVSDRSAMLVLPVGATLNMDGTTLYEGVAVIFIAQTLGIPLALSDVFVVFLLSTLAAMAAAAIPEAGLVTMVIILRALNLPLESIGLLLSIDWFLDRCRTTVNVWGDSVGAAVLDRIGRSSSIRLEAV